MDYIKLNRKIVEWEWYSDINTCRLFIHMLLRANWKDGKFQGTTVPRGSFVSSIGKLSEETCLTIREVRTAISHLKLTGEVTSKTTNRYTVFTVINYNFYQSNDMQNDSQETTQRQPNDNPTTTIEEYKEGKKERSKDIKVSDDTFCAEPDKPPSAPPVITLPLNDKTEHPVYQQDIDEWQELYPAVDVLQELRKMKGWLMNNPTRGKTKRGIGRFINNWLSREQDRGGSAAGSRSREDYGGFLNG